MRASITKLAAAAFVTLAGFVAPAQASPLDAGLWTQVGNMSAGGGVFNGNCNLLATCNYAVDADGDFWSSFDTFAGQEMLFITGDRQTWARASYALISGIVSTAGNVFSPNITWNDAGRSGTSLGSGIVGNILMRTPYAEDPWVTLEGSHCANGCAEMLWGENNWPGSAHAGHVALKNASQGVQVFVTAPAPVPLPAGGVLLLTGLATAFALRRTARSKVSA